jgi:hypothetical protein
MFASGRGVLVSLLAMFVSRFRVPLRLFVLAEVMMMGGLMMMMRGSVMISGGLMMMLAGRMLRGLCHGAFLPTGLGKMDAGCRLTIDSIVPTKVWRSHFSPIMFDPLGWGRGPVRGRPDGR